MTEDFLGGGYVYATADCSVGAVFVEIDFEGRRVSEL